MPGKYPMRVERITEETPDIRIFRLVPTNGPLFDYLSGQFIILNIPDPNGGIKRRSYSIASTPLDRDHLELCIKIKDMGETGPLVKAIKQGAELLVEGPYGRFTLNAHHADGSRIFLVGTGSGIAPLMSMVRTLARQAGHPATTLIYGFRHPADFAYQEELLAMASSTITIIPVASTPDQAWTGKTGHVQDIIRTIDVTGSSWFLCGPPVMAQDVVTLLRGRGVPDEQIKREMYD